jgi:hypothetical protein
VAILKEYIAKKALMLNNVLVGTIQSLGGTCCSNAQLEMHDTEPERDPGVQGAVEQDSDGIWGRPVEVKRSKAKESCFSVSREQCVAQTHATFCASSDHGKDDLTGAAAADEHQEVMLHAKLQAA